MVSLTDRVAVCEPRLALSAGAAAEVLIDAFAANPFGLQTFGSPSGAATAPWTAEPHSFDGAGQSVAVIDSGIAWDHVVFQRANAAGASEPLGLGIGNRVVAGWDFAEEDANPYDDGPAGFHGTHVAGTLAGFTDGFAGIAPGADLVALRVFDDSGRSSLDWIEAALRWVIDHRTTLEHPITTVNVSLGAFATDSSQPLTQLDDELHQLRDDGVIVVAAAGNSFLASQPSALAYPASHPLVAAVTSVDTSGNVHDFAQRASGVFAMPGSAIHSSVPDHVLGVDGRSDDFASVAGTSMATPQFAGATMLVRQAMQSIGMDPTAEEILSQLRETSREHVDAASGAAYYQVDVDSAISQLLAAHAGDASPPVPDASPLQWTSQASLFISSTADSDQIILDLSGPATITINSVAFAIDRPFDALIIDGGVGNDTLRVIGGSVDEHLIARAPLPGNQEAIASLQRAGLSADFLGFENVIFQSGGGNDRATLFDSVGDDQLEADPTTATLRGVGYTFVAIDVNHIYAHGTNGGSDTAYLHDSSGDDRLAIRHQFTSLRNDSQFRLAYGFEKVHAFAGAGGNDRADLYDSPGDDRFAASPSLASISTRDYYAGARGFATIHAESSAGGNDLATLYAADTAALWTRSSSLLQWNLPGGEARIAHGFETAEAYIGGEKAEVLSQSLRQAFHEQERHAARLLFALLDEERDDSAAVLI